MGEEGNPHFSAESPSQRGGTLQVRFLKFIKKCIYMYVVGLLSCKWVLYLLKLELQEYVGVRT